MKHYIAILTLSALMTAPAFAQEHEHHQGHDMSKMEGHMHDEHMADHQGMMHGDHAAMTIVRQVEPVKVCMVNDTAFDTDQIAVEVEGATYYGCCPMCKERLKKDASMRMAIDPISGNEVDKAKAVIGADANGKVQYFESEENLHASMGHK